MNPSAQHHFDRAEQLAWRQHDYAAAIREYDAALALDPQMAEAHLGIGEVYYFQQEGRQHPDMAPAIQAYRKAIELAPQWPRAHARLAHTLLLAGQVEEAVAAAREAVRLAPGEDYYHQTLGSCLMEQEAYPEAIADLRESLRIRQIKPNYCEMSAHVALAEALAKDGQIEEAIREWEVALDTEPDWVEEEGHTRKWIEKQLEKYRQQIA